MVMGVPSGFLLLRNLVGSSYVALNFNRWGFNVLGEGCRFKVSGVGLGAS